MWHRSPLLLTAVLPCAVSGTAVVLLLLGAGRAAIDRHLLPAGPTAANPLHAAAAVDSGDRQTDGHRTVTQTLPHTMRAVTGADFRFEVPGQSSVGLIGGGRGQWLGGTMASAEHEPIMGVWWQRSGQGSEAHLKLKAFWSLDVQRSRQI